MNTARKWQSLKITGMVLSISGLVFLAVSLMFQVNYFWGIALGCLGSGVALFLVGAIRVNKEQQAKPGDS